MCKISPGVFRYFLYEPRITSGAGVLLEQRAHRHIFTKEEGAVTLLRVSLHRVGKPMTKTHTIRSTRETRHKVKMKEEKVGVRVHVGNHSNYMQSEAILYCMQNIYFINFIFNLSAFVETRTTMNLHKLTKSPVLIVNISFPDVSKAKLPVTGVCSR